MPDDPIALETALVWVQGWGPTAYLLAPLVMVVCAVLPIPAEVPAVANGILFGPIWGTAITWVGAVIGAQTSFELSRRYGTALFQKVTGVEGRPIELSDHSSKCVLVLLTSRLIPLVPFTLLNWAAGATSISRWTFFWTTAIGILPATILFSVTGCGLACLCGGWGIATIASVALIILLLSLFLRRSAKQVFLSGSLDTGSR